MGSHTNVKWLDSGRGVAMLMVVGGHTIDWTQADEVDPAAKVILSLIVSCSLPLFFYISGSLAEGVPAMSWRELMARRVVPLAWIFLLWQPVVFAYKLIAEASLPGQDAPSVTAVLARLLAAPIRPTGELWFIWALALFFVLARILRPIPLWVQLAVATMIAVLWTGGATSLLGEASVAAVGVGWNGLLSYWVFFLMGLSLYRLRGRIASTPRWAGALMAILWIATVTVLSVLALTAVPVLSFGVKILGLMGGIGLARCFDWSTAFRYVGRATMPLYLVHTTVIVVVLSVATATGVAPVPWTGTGALALWALAVAAGLGMDVVVRARGATWLVRDAPRWLVRRLGLAEQHVAHSDGRVGEHARG